MANYTDANNVLITLLAYGKDAYTSSYYKFILPVNPEKIEIKRQKNYATSTTINLGEIDVPLNGIKITEITFSSFFPDKYDSAYCTSKSIPMPEEAMQALTYWTNSHHPVKLVITGGPELNIWCYITAHESVFNGGEPGDIYYTLTFRPWREIKIEKTASGGKSNNKSSKTNSKKNSKRTRIDAKITLPTTYTVKKGDNLWSVAKYFYGDGDKWNTIYTANKSIIGANPRLIYPMAKLKIPKI